MRKPTVLALSVIIAFLGMSSPAFAGIEALVAGAIQGFLLSAAGVAVTTATATTLANIAIGGSNRGISILAKPALRKRDADTMSQERSL